MTSIRKQRWKSIYRNGWSVWSRQQREAQMVMIDLLLEIVEHERDVLLAEIEYERTHCSVCNHPWSDHDFGVPRPECP
jgi:hypothetical protein